MDGHAAFALPGRQNPPVLVVGNGPLSPRAPPPALRWATGGLTVADDIQLLPTDSGAAMRELMRRIRDDGLLIYSEGPDHLATQPAPPKPDLIRDGIRKHHALFVALATPDDLLDENGKRTILRHDVRVGFQPSNDWQGAAQHLREQSGMI
jgi:hypothetical protein